MECYIRGDGERAHAQGALYLTNIQQFYERPDEDDDEPDAMTGVLGPKPPASNWRPRHSKTGSWRVAGR